MRCGVEPPGRAGRRHRPAAGRDRGAAGRRPADRRRSCRNSDLAAAPADPRRATRCCPRRSWPAPPASCATWPPSAATCCSAPAARTSTTSRPPATSASPARAAPPARGSPRLRACSGASEHCVATHPSRHGRRAGRPGRRVELTSAAGRPRAWPSTSSTGCPGTTPQLDTVLAPGELITAVELPPRPARRARTTARCATGPPTRSRWSPSPRRSRSRTAGSPTPGSRWAGSRTSRGGPRRRVAALRCRADRRGVRRGGGRRARRRETVARQRVQDRT